MDPAAIAAIYDFEGILEKPLVLFFKDNEVQAITSQQVIKTGDKPTDDANEANGYTLIEFQKPRPRTEITFVPGAGAGQFAAQVISGIEMPMETCWSGQLKLDLITDANIQSHAAYRTFIRYLIHSQLRSLNGNQLQQHKIQEYYRDGGTSPLMKSENGYFRTTLLFELNLSVQDYAWATLEN